MALVIVISGGGTGGHVMPALALADSIRRAEPGARVHFIGSERGQEREHVRAAGYTLDTVPASPVVGRGPLRAARGLFTLARGVLSALRVLLREQPRIVIGVGGYASVPAVAAASLLRIPTALVEADARPGSANRLLSRLAKRVFVQFDAAIRHFPSGRAKLTGFPVRELPAPSPREDSDVIRLLITGGSQGARSINRAVCNSLEQLSERDGFRITHQCGRLDIDEVRAAYERAGVVADVEPFFPDMPRRIADADLIVARAGASTLAEIAVAGVPAILVPYPYSAHGHQLDNARALESDGAAVVVTDDELEGRLASEIRALVQDPVRRQLMAEASARRAVPDAADRIWSACQELL
jgi:UDP-N-acetylglucosamine--N-acetylmuramyl-(pentapeptide) pyrophosphoryl-undecaprenol N-acetylglucosamine transferase